MNAVHLVTEDALLYNRIGEALLTRDYCCTVSEDFRLEERTFGTIDVLLLDDLSAASVLILKCVREDDQWADLPIICLMGTGGYLGVRAYQYGSDMVARRFSQPTDIVDMIQRLLDYIREWRTS